VPRRRLSLLALILASACSGRPGGPPAEQPTLDDPAAGPAVRSETTLPEPLVAMLRGRPLLVEDFRSLMLFADERLAAQQIIADWATGNGLTVLPPAATELTIAQAGQGLDPTTGKACGPSLERALAVERWVRAAGSITAAVYCKATCTLQVEFRLNGRGTEFYAAAFDTGRPWREELKARLATVVDNGGHERYGHGNNPVEVAGLPRGAKDLVPDDDDELVAGDPEELARRCGLKDLGVAVLLEVQGGKLRCERFADPSYVTDPDPTLTACACAELTSRPWPAGRQYTRLQRTYDPSTWVPAKGGRWVSAMLIGGNEYRTEGVAWFVPGRHELRFSECFAGRGAQREELEVAALLSFDRDGAVRDVVFDDPKKAMQPTEQACVKQALGAVRTPCPAGAEAKGTARIVWRVGDKP
jgi:hypothetical protein